MAVRTDCAYVILLPLGLSVTRSALGIHKNVVIGPIRRVVSGEKRKKVQAKEASMKEFNRSSGRQ